MPQCLPITCLPLALLILVPTAFLMPLQPCGEDIVLPEESDDTTVSRDSSLASCTSQREEEAALHHQHLLQRPNYHQQVIIRCPICPGDDPVAFTWYFAPRSPDTLLTPDEEGGVSLSRKILKVLTQERFSGENIPCVFNLTNELYIPEFDVDLHVGTYVCRNIEDDTHLANQIWYHLDVVLPPESEGLSTPLSPFPRELQEVQKIALMKDAMAIMKKASEALKSTNQSVEYSTPVLSITSRLTPLKQPTLTCGKFTLTQCRRCYVSIPVEVSQGTLGKVSPGMALNYELLKTAFGSFYTWMGASDPSILYTQRLSAEARAAELGFELYYSGKERPASEELDEEENEDPDKEEVPNTEYLIPCHWTYFQHVNLSKELPAPFAIPNICINVSFHLPCPEVDYMEIINIALATKDTKLMKGELLGYEEKRFMKLEKVALEGTQDFELICGGEGEKLDLNCSNPNNVSVLWKQEKGITFTGRTFIGERVYVTEDCRLRFLEVKKEDEGVYSCYKRDTRFPDQWQSTAFLSFRLKTEKTSMKFPSASDLLIGLMFLALWATILILVWILLSIWSLETSRLAVIQATDLMRKRDMEFRERANLEAKRKLLEECEKRKQIGLRS